MVWLTNQVVKICAFEVIQALTTAEKKPRKQRSFWERMKSGTEIEKQASICAYSIGDNMYSGLCK